jgi:hypothetical protein
MQGTPPSHPELLDWLACELMSPSAPDAQPWSIKRMQRLVLTSATYRQSSHAAPELFARDPSNRLLARGPRFRVEAEIVRDVALAASGLLNPKIGGPSVMPPAPAFLFQPPSSFASFPWVDETSDEKYRRALYTFHRRSTPYPMLQAFDGPTAQASCTRRWRANTPLQALTTLNEPIFVDCARALAKKSVAEGGNSDAERITFAFRRTLSRAPTKPELDELLRLLNDEQQRYARDLDPARLVGERSPQMAAYTVVARVLLNLDETITKE